MKTCACDVCGKTVPTVHTLIPEYQFDGIVDACDGCLKILNDHKKKLDKVAVNIVTGWLRAFMRNLRSNVGRRP